MSCCCGGVIYTPHREALGDINSTDKQLVKANHLGWVFQSFRSFVCLSVCLSVQHSAHNIPTMLVGSAISKGHWNMRWKCYAQLRPVLFAKWEITSAAYSATQKDWCLFVWSTLAPPKASATECVPVFKYNAYGLMYGPRTFFSAWGTGGPTLRAQQCYPYCWNGPEGLQLWHAGDKPTRLLYFMFCCCTNYSDLDIAIASI